MRPCSSTTIPFSHARPAASGELDVGQHADPDHDEVGRVALAVGHHHGLSSPLFALDPVDPGIQHQLDAAVAVQPGVEFGDHRRHDPAHQPLGRLQHCHRFAQHPRRGGDLEPDEPAADDDHAPGLGDAPRQGLRFPSVRR